MTTNYRRFVSDEGEALYAGLDPFAFLERMSEVVELTGLDYTDLAPTRLLGQPLLQADDDNDLSLVRYAANANALWHPMFWLPEHLAAPANVTYEGDTEEEESVETLSQWGIRVMQTLSGCGMFNTDTGQWLDVLALYDIDIDTDEGIARVEAWQNGTEDDVLDSIDLADRIGMETQQSYIDAQHLAMLIDAIVWRRDAQEIQDFIAAAEIEEMDRHDLALEASTATLVSLGAVSLTPEDSVKDIISGLMEEHWAAGDDDTVLSEVAELCVAVGREFSGRAAQANQIFEDIGATA